MQSLDGTKRCPMCAFEVTEEAEVCGKCGLSLKGQQQLSLGSFKLSELPPETSNVVEESPKIETTISSSHEEKPPILDSPSPSPTPSPSSTASPSPTPSPAPTPPPTPAPVLPPRKGFLDWLRSLFKR